MRLVVLSLFFCIGIVGCNQCSQHPATASSAVDAQDPAKMVVRGKTVYMSSCIACHNSDPSKAGALGPEVTGASKDLLEARIMRAAYPPGYTPKRPNSKSMVAMPYLKNDIDALFAFLNQ